MAFIQIIETKQEFKFLLQSAFYIFYSRVDKHFFCYFFVAATLDNESSSKRSAENWIHMEKIFQCTGVHISVRISFDQILVNELQAKYLLLASFVFWCIAFLLQIFGGMSFIGFDLIFRVASPHDYLQLYWL